VNNRMNHGADVDRRREQNLNKREQDLRERELEIRERELRQKEQSFGNSNRESSSTNAQADTVKKPLSWGWIIFWCIFFWPVGLFLVFQRANTDRSAILKNSKTVRIISFVLMGFGAVYLVLSFTNSDFLAATVLLGGGGVWLFITSRNMKEKAEKYKKYIDIVINQGQTSIDYIASAVGKSSDEVQKDLQKMIDEDYFPKAYIDQGTRTIMLPQTEVEQAVQDSAESVQTEVVTCPACRARNLVVVGQHGRCEYCRTLL